MTEALKDKPISSIEFAKNELTGKLLQICVSQLDKLKTPWSHTSEKNQEIALNAMRQAVTAAVTDAVMIINADRKPRLDATVDSVTFKDEIKATLTLSKAMGGRHELADAAGSTVSVIIARPEDFTGGGNKVKPQPDQKSLLEKTDANPMEGYEIVPPKDGFKFRVKKDGMPIPKAPKGFETQNEAEKWLQNHLGLNKPKDGEKPDPAAAAAPGAKTEAGEPGAEAAATTKPAAKLPDLDEAKAAFKKAACDEAKKEVSDWDGAWTQVAAKYPNDFVEEHYDELSKEFADGWEDGQGE